MTVAAVARVSTGASTMAAMLKEDFFIKSLSLLVAQRLCRPICAVSRNSKRTVMSWLLGAAGLVGNGIANSCFVKGSKAKDAAVAHATGQILPGIA